MAQAPDPSRFEADLSVIHLGAVTLTSFSSTEFSTIRRRKNIRAADRPTVYFGIVSGGTLLVRQDGRQSQSGAGSAVLVRSWAPLQTKQRMGAGGVRFQCSVAAVPLSALVGREQIITQLTATALPATALLAAASTFLSAVAVGLPQPGSATADFVEHAIIDLLLAVLAEQRSVAQPVESGEAGTRIRIRDFVLRRLPDVELGPRRIAQEFGISTRYLHRLFEAEDSSVSSFIRAERLKKAADELVNPSLRVDIAAIAARSGFAGADQFARAFKARYGLSPRDYRRSVRVDPSGPSGVGDSGVVQ